MRRSLIPFLASFALMSPALAHAGQNVALKAAVTTTGGGFSQYSNQWGAGRAASPASATDGTFLANGSQWNLGTVFWYGPKSGDVSDYVTVSLKRSATVTGFTLQTDNNDTYEIQYQTSSGQWANLISVTPSEIPNWGLDTTSVSLTKPVTTDAFRISASSGDGAYALSQFEAFGAFTSAAPEPAAWSLMLMGVGAVGAGLRTRRRKAIAA